MTGMSGGFIYGYVWIALRRQRIGGEVILEVYHGAAQAPRRHQNRGIYGSSIRAPAKIGPSDLAFTDAAMGG